MGWLIIQIPATVALGLCLGFGDIIWIGLRLRFAVRRRPWSAYLVAAQIKLDGDLTRFEQRVVLRIAGIRPAKKRP